MKKKVLFLMDRMDNGGVPRVLLNILENIDQSKFDVTVAITSEDDIWEARIPEWVKVKNLFKKSPNRSEYKIVRILYLICMMIIPGSIIRKLTLGNDKYDVYIDFFGTMYGFWKGVNVKKVVWLHKDYSMESNPIEKEYIDKYSQTLNYKLKSFYQRKTFEECDNLVAISKTMQHSFATRFGFREKIKVLYNPIDQIDIFKKIKEPTEIWGGEGPLFCSMTRVSRGKGCERLLRSCKRLLDEGYVFRLSIVGGGDGLDSLKQTYQSLNLKEKDVRLYGDQNNPFKILNEADVFISPSETEAFSMSLAEAIIIQKPIITTDVGSAKELFGNNEYGYVIDNSEESIYQALKFFLENPEVVDNYKNKVKKIGPTLSIDKTIFEIEKFILR